MRVSFIVAIFGNLSIVVSHVASTKFSTPEYQQLALHAANVAVQTWYNPKTGLWGNLWWQSANMLTTIGDLTLLDPPAFNETADFLFETTHKNAAGSLGGNFRDGYYDDEGWWALAWIKAYDITCDRKYLETARELFQDMMTGADGACGGHWWNKQHTAVGAIANELYFTVAAFLAVRLGSKGVDYHHIAVESFDWFLHSGLIDSRDLVRNNLNLKTCKSEGLTFTYNQGVVLGGLVALHNLTSNQTYIDIAAKIANAAIDDLTDQDGILTEPWGSPMLDQTGAQFKGVFVRNLRRLYNVAPEPAFVAFLQKNAESIWKYDTIGGAFFGPRWQGPFPTREKGVASQGSAIDCLVAAVAVS